MVKNEAVRLGEGPVFTVGDKLEPAAIYSFVVHCGLRWDEFEDKRPAKKFLSHGELSDWVGPGKVNFLFDESSCNPTWEVVGIE